MSAKDGEDTLDAWVLAENKIVTYRLLSRLLRMKGQAAKDMMRDWHAKRPSTHATYILCGHNSGPSKQEPSSNEASTQSHLNSSSSLSHESVDKVQYVTLELVPEENLEEAKARFSSVSYCHIYSLEPAKLKDINLLSSCKEDITEAMKGQSTRIKDLAATYEIIYNAQVHEMEEKIGHLPVPQRIMKPIFKRTETQTSVESGDKMDKESSAVPAPSNDVKVPATKRGASSSLASAFAKTPKPKPKNPPAAAPAVVPKLEKTQSVEEKVAEPVIKTKESLKKQEENAVLREMMEMEDDNVEQQGGSQTVENHKEDADMLDPADWSASDTEMKDAEPQPIPPPRKRGRKKVKRQVHTKDAKGYMVTKEEWEWVSCDEDEVAAPPALVKQASSASSKGKPAVQQKKKAGGIASYFTKR